MDKMAQAVAAALNVLNPQRKRTVKAPSLSTTPDRDNCDKSTDNHDNFPTKAT